MGLLGACWAPLSSAVVLRGLLVQVVLGPVAGIFQGNGPSDSSAEKPT